MEIRGKIILVLPLQSGTSKAGNEWKKQEYVLETLEQYPRKVCFQFFGDKVDQYPTSVGQEVVVSFDIDSREFNGRWYTNISAWKLEVVTADAPSESPVAPPPAVDFFPPSSESATDDLPF